MGIPFFALAITHLSGVLGPYGPRTFVYWAGCAWFVLLSALLWHANRYLLVRWRGRYDWRERPLRKAALLLAGIVATSVPLVVAMHLVWYRFAGLPVSWRQLAATALVIVASVAFVSHAYETAFLVQQRQHALLQAERHDRARVEAELHALKAQVDPHVLGNALTALAWLIPRDAARALRFVEKLGQVYGYILSTRARDLVPLEEELRFGEAYVELLHLRFGNALRVRREGEAPAGGRIPPVSLQVLLENAVKHNAAREEEPLEVDIRILADRVLVSNRKAPVGPGTSTGVGLANLDNRCRRLLGRNLEVSDSAATFSVGLPFTLSG